MAIPHSRKVFSVSIFLGCEKPFFNNNLFLSLHILRFGHRNTTRVLLDKSVSALRPPYFFLISWEVGTSWTLFHKREHWNNLF